MTDQDHARELMRRNPASPVESLIVLAFSEERARCAAICREAPYQEGQWLANLIEGIDDEC